MAHLGIDLGGTNIAGAITDDACRIIARASLPTQPECGPETILDDMGRVALQLLQNTGMQAEDFAYAGIGAPGIANSESGLLEFNANLNFYAYPMTEAFKKRTGFSKVYLDNDANAAAVGEALAGAGKGRKIFAMVTLGTGVGGGVVIDGKVLSGMGHLAGEFGHMVLEHTNGRLCTCGRRGCFEAYCSATALLKEAKSQMADHPESFIARLTGSDASRITVPMIFQADAAGDPLAQNLMQEYIDYLACGISNLMNIFDPDVLCIGGGISEAGPVLLEKLYPKVLQSTYGHEVNAPEKEKARIRLAELGNDAGLIGAAWLRG